MSLGVDAVHLPSIDVLKATGITFVCRYVSTPNNRKNLTRAEAEALSRAGISIVTNYETTADAMISSAAAGKAAAVSALAQARACGMPAGRPIYFSLDVDPAALSPAQWDKVFAFLDGAASVLGRAAVGVYGGYEAIARIRQAGKAAFFWQTYAWSHGKVHPGIHIYQFKNSQPLGGTYVDYDRSYAPDFGQWSLYGSVPSATPATSMEDDLPYSEDDLKRIVLSALNEGTAKGQRSWADTSAAVLGTIQHVVNQLNGVQAALDKILAKLS